MPVIIGINPTKRRKAKTVKKSVSKKRKARTMAKRKKSTKPKVRYKTREVVKYRYRNPAPKKTTRRRNPNGDPFEFGKIIRSAAALSFGMVCAKVAVNKLTKGGSETELWSWPNIAMAAVTSMLVAAAFGSIFKVKKNTAAMIALGGISLAFYKIITTKFAPEWNWTQEWFGADEIDPQYLGADDIDIFEPVAGNYGYLPGQGYEDQAADQMLGEMGNDPAYTDYMMGQTDAGGQVVPFDPAMGSVTDSGGQVVPFNPAMGAAGDESLSELQAIGQRVANAYPGSY